MANDGLFRHSEIILDADHQGELLVGIEHYQRLLDDASDAGNLGAQDYAQSMRIIGNVEARIAANIATQHDIEVVEGWREELDTDAFTAEEDPDEC